MIKIIDNYNQIKQSLLKMKEIILSINEVTDKIIEVDDKYLNENYSWGLLNNYDGYEIITTRQKITLLICNSKQCCEKFGYFFINDDVESFINAELLDIEIVDKDLNKIPFKDKVDLKYYKLHEVNAVFVDLITSNGVLQFVVYNAQNGYYAHKIMIISKQLMYTHNI